MPEVNSIKKRKGVVHISHELLMCLDIDLVSKLFAKLIIVKAEDNFITDIIDYYALSEEFDEIEPCSRPPIYLVNFENDEISFEKI